MLTVSIIEDDGFYRELLSRTVRSFIRMRLLSAHPTGEDAVTHFPHPSPDVALVDIKLPGIDGIECIRRLRARVPSLPTQFLILTSHGDDQLIFDALKAGADGYLLKERTSTRQLLAAIKEVFGGGAPTTPYVGRKIFASFRNNPGAKMELLTKREQEVLRCLARGLMYKEIADELSMTISTVRAHMVSVYHKLHIHSRWEATAYFTGQESTGQHTTRQTI